MFSHFFKTAAVVAVAISALSAEQFSGKRGDFWTGGSFNFMSMWASNSSGSEQVISLNPMARFFPANNLCIGPKFTWTGMFSEGSSQNMVGLGLDFGFGGGSSTFGYFLISPHFEFINSSYSYDFSSGDYSSSDRVFFLPFTAGTILPIGRGLGIEFEAGYSLGFNMNSSGSGTANILSFGIGICGIGQTTAVSFVNVFNFLTSAF